MLGKNLTKGHIIILAIVALAIGVATAAQKKEKDTTTSNGKSQETKKDGTKAQPTGKESAKGEQSEHVFVNAQGEPIVALEEVKGKTTFFFQNEKDVDEFLKRMKAAKERDPKAAIAAAGKEATGKAVNTKEIKTDSTLPSKSALLLSSCHWDPIEKGCRGGCYTSSERCFKHVGFGGTYCICERP